MRLAVFIARKQSGPRRLLTTFPLDRRALALLPDLDLTVDTIRGAIKTLIKIGFVENVPDTESKLYRQGDNGPQRLPLKYQFSYEFHKIFRYIAYRMSQSPGSRQNLKLDKDRKSEAPLLGEKRRRPAPGSKVEEAPLPLFAQRPQDGLGRANKPLRPIDLGTIKDDGLRAAISRLGRNVSASIFDEGVAT